MLDKASLSAAKSKGQTLLSILLARSQTSLTEVVLVSHIYAATKILMEEITHFLLKDTGLDGACIMKAHHSNALAPIAVMKENKTRSFINLHYLISDAPSINISC